MKGPNGDVQRDSKSRLQKYDDANMDAPIPELPDGASYLMDAMFSLGPLRATLEGVRAADWAEIYPFMAATRAITKPDEAETLHRMCAAYLIGLNAGRNPFGISPMDRDNS